MNLAANTFRVFDNALAQCEQRIVLTTTNVLARMNTGATLANEDHARADLLTSETFATKTLRLRIATITDGTLTFLVCRSVPSFLFLRFSRTDRHDLHAREILTMTTGALVILALLELEDDLLFALELLDDLSLYLGLRSFSGIGNNFVAIDNSDSRKGNLRAHFSIELFDIEIVSSGNLVLLTTGLYDCVHAYSYKCVKTQAVILSAWQGRVNKNMRIYL